MTQDTEAKTPAFMIQATGSDAGKSLIVAGLCRLFTRRGLKVRPFKPQNMSNNAAVTEEGGEIGRAQALQARACRVPPSVHMNPVLLKPEGETGAQIVVQGKVHGRAAARDYAAKKAELLEVVLDSFQILQRSADVVIAEGAGSPAEINLRAGDIANMGFAEAADVPVILVGDIDRGGVIASLVGTHALLPEAERARVKGIIINKFRGDVSLFADGAQIIEERTGWPCLGIVPWFAEANKLPAEDSVALDAKARKQTANHDGKITVAVPRLPRIANFDDVDPLASEADVEIIWVERGRHIPATADLILLPGTKATISDLEFLKAQGWDVDIKAHHRRGGHVLGLCGGYQMLGRVVRDSEGIEGKQGETAGLGLLEIETMLTPSKRLENVSGIHVASASPVRGYEMHMGETTGPALAKSFLHIDGRPEGAVSADGRIVGSYVHGIFADDDFRHHYLSGIKARRQEQMAYEEEVDTVLDALAYHLEANLDIAQIEKIANSR